MHTERKISYVIASDVNPRDGIGLETHVNGDLVMEIFRDDSERRTYLTMFSSGVDLEVVEASIETFKKRVDLNYIDYPDEPAQA